MYVLYPWPQAKKTENPRAIANAGGSEWFWRELYAAGHHALRALRAGITVGGGLTLYAVWFKSLLLTLTVTTELHPQHLQLQRTHRWGTSCSYLQFRSA